MSVHIKHISWHLPEHPVTNDWLHQENPAWDMAKVEERAGVKTRYVAASDQTALDLAETACRKLFDEYDLDPKQVDGLIFCTQSPDYIMPPNACVLQKRLKLKEELFAFDFNLACSGYVYGLALARGLIVSGMASRLLLVNADTYSRYIHPKDRSTRVLFGDGAAVSLIEAVEDETGIVDMSCATSGRNFDAFMIPAGGCRTPSTEETRTAVVGGCGNVRSEENIHMEGMRILTFVNSKIPKQIRALLKKNELEVDDLDYLVFHQASKMALDSLIRILKLPPEKVPVNVDRIGNTVSASIPILLGEMMAAGKLAPGTRILMCGFGVGLSWGSAILRF